MNVKLTCIDSTTDNEHTWRKPKPAPSRCNLCNAKLQSFYIKGMTRHGLFKTMCITCHDAHGVGFSFEQGRGSMFAINADGTSSCMWGA